MSAKTERSLVRKNAKREDLVTVHFVEDGLTAFGKLWYRGENLTIERGSPEWEQTFTDEEGTQSWLELDEDGQVDRWGVRFFRPGTWTGGGFELDPEVELSEEEVAALAAAEASLSSPVSTVPAAPKVPAKKRGPGRPPGGVSVAR